MRFHLLIGLLAALACPAVLRAQVWSKADSVWLSGILSGKDTLRLDPETERAIRSTERELTRTEREIAQLRIHRERLCSRPHINAMIARFHLNLVEPAVGQVSHLALLMPDRTATPLQPAVALRTTAGNGGTRRN